MGFDQLNLSKECLVLGALLVVDLDVDSRLDGDVGKLLHQIRRGSDVDDTLVDAHLPAIEGVGTLTARRFANHESQDLGGHAHRALNLDLGIVDSDGSGLQVSAQSLKTLDLAGGQGDAEVQVRDGLGDLLGLIKIAKETE